MNLINKDYHKNEIEAHVSSNDLCLYEDVDCVHMQTHGSWTCIFVFMYHEIVLHADVHFHSETQLNHFFCSAWSLYWKIKFQGTVGFGYFYIVLTCSDHEINYRFIYICKVLYQTDYCWLTSVITDNNWRSISGVPNDPSTWNMKIWRSGDLSLPTRPQQCPFKWG